METEICLRCDEDFIPEIIYGYAGEKWMSDECDLCMTARGEKADEQRIINHYSE